MNEHAGPLEVVTDEYIHNELIDFYVRAQGQNEAVQNSKFVATEIENELYGPQGWLFTLDGVPARGYALYFPDEQAVYFYDCWGNKHNELFSTDVKGYVEDINP